ncbi:MarR family winged helix-turn-helix transcriptional regulator [Vibrio rhodolitus]|uniref:MarR family winged helix-turn-helix transcriptional regulator n=1 Tax=Vibrio rhodolitus TaxID=2231649 RepID=UPI000E0A2F7D|nr:MarR family transcriptional regulator [Vibrio rhodolitus]
MPIDKVANVLLQWSLVRPDLDCTSMGIIGRVRRTSGEWQKKIDGFFKLKGLSSTEFDILATLRRVNQPATPTEIYRSTMLSSGAVSTNLEKLVQAGWVARTASDEDRRSCKVYLTEQGIALVDDVVTQHVANMDDLLSPLSASEQQQLQQLLEKLMPES